MRGFEVKLYPNKSQIEQLNKEFNCSRFIYNKMIEISQKKYHRTGKSLSGYDMQSYLPKLKKEFVWLKEPSAQQLQITCHNLAEAYNRFFKKLSKYPSFKKRSSKASYAVVTGVTLLDTHIKLPKLGLVRYRGGDKPLGEIKRVTVKKSASGRFYASVLFDTKETPQESKPFSTITGIDLGIKDYLICSNGDFIKNPKHLRVSEKKLKERQRRLSKSLKGSKKRNQRRIILARTHEKIAFQRKDFTHKVSKILTSKCENQAFALEDLNINGMIKNHNLAKSIADCSWGMFKTFLNYKAASLGKQVFTVDRFYPSSKTCSSCGIVNNMLTLDQRSWNCPHCGSVHDRDLNAAINISKEAWRNYASGGAISPETLERVVQAAPAKLKKSLYIQ